MEQVHSCSDKEMLGVLGYLEDASRNFNITINRIIIALTCIQPGSQSIYPD